MKTTVIHHSADFDGLFCREIARKFLPDAELIGWDYGNPLIPVPDGMVYILDLSPECLDFTGQKQKSMTYPCDWLVWIDHHKSAMDKFSSRINGYCIDGVAACRLAWQWYLMTRGEHDNDIRIRVEGGNDIHGFSLPLKQDFVDRTVSEPLAVRLAGEYDIWDKRDPNAELFQHGLRSCELTSAIWNIMLSLDHSLTPSEFDLLVDSGQDAAEIKSQLPANPYVVMLLERGNIIQYAKTQENEGIIKSYGFDVEFEGLKFLACNHARFNSHLFTAGIRPEHDALLGFNWSGTDWRVSLYHAPGKEQHDLSLIAVKHGGGGHRGACGFRVKSLPFLT